MRTIIVAIEQFQTTNMAVIHKESFLNTVIEIKQGDTIDNPGARSESPFVTRFELYIAGSFDTFINCYHNNKQVQQTSLNQIVQSLTRTAKNKLLKVDEQ